VSELAVLDFDSLSSFDIDLQVQSNGEGGKNQSGVVRIANPSPINKNLDLATVTVPKSLFKTWSTAHQVTNALRRHGDDRVLLDVLGDFVWDLEVHVLPSKYPQIPADPPGRRSKLPTPSLEHFEYLEATTRPGGRSDPRTKLEPPKPKPPLPDVRDPATEGAQLEFAAVDTELGRLGFSSKPEVTLFMMPRARFITQNNSTSRFMEEPQPSSRTHEGYFRPGITPGQSKATGMPAQPPQFHVGDRVQGFLDDFIAPWNINFTCLVEPALGPLAAKDLSFGVIQNISPLREGTPAGFRATYRGPHGSSERGTAFSARLLDAFSGHAPWAPQTAQTVRLGESSFFQSVDTPNQTFDAERTEKGIKFELTHVEFAGQFDLYVVLFSASHRTVFFLYHLTYEFLRNWEVAPQRNIAPVVPGRMLRLSEGAGLGGTPIEDFVTYGPLANSLTIGSNPFFHLRKFP